jgi:hypothetical protein
MCDCLCDCLEEKFVVPNRPAYGMGWWLGQIINAVGNTCMVSVIWVQSPGYRGTTTMHVIADSVTGFETETDAMKHLRKERAAWKRQL